MNHSPRSECGRDPCPWRILDDIGDAFIFGAFFGSLYYSVKGWRNSPKGERMFGTVNSIKTRVPTMSGRFAVWGGLFSTFDCTFAAIRQKEDPWNSIASGALAGGLVAARGGSRAFAKNAAIGGVLLGLIEGLNIFITNSLTPKPANMGPDMITQNAVPPMVTAVISGSAETPQHGMTGHYFDVNSTLDGNTDPSALQEDSLSTDKYR